MDSLWNEIIIVGAFENIHEKWQSSPTQKFLFENNKIFAVG